MPPSTTTEAIPPRPSRLWWWVVAACLLQIAVWTGWFILAAHHPVEEVQLETSPKR